MSLLKKISWRLRVEDDTCGKSITFQLPQSQLFISRVLPRWSAEQPHASKRRRLRMKNSRRDELFRVSLDMGFKKYRLLLNVKPILV
ncbi:hypothetical protein CDAR_300151 [Caerostris darwini]|uniref:Uncharacterized protein n=1 Tax=Caerostris darwini TaxID=1538125 RepID=A0AAV4W6C2_9ARAC|nr:hypothetical protein CDAR_300151 [Caerostris darwini]